MYANFGFILERKRDLHPQKVAVIDHSRNISYTYKELDALANRTANALCRAGIVKGDRVAALIENCPEFFALLFACSKLGAILVPVNFRLESADVQFIVKDVSPRLLVYDPQFASRLWPWVNDMSDKVKLIALLDGHDNHKTFADFIGAEEDESPGVKATEHDINVILYTSGSTGRPKGVMQTHLNTFLKSVDQIVDLEPTHEDVLLTMAPIFHVGGLNILTMSVIHVGGTVVLQNRFEPKEALGIIEKRNATLLFAIPTMLKMMIGHEAWKDANIRSLRYVVSGGEAVPQKVKEALAAKGVQVLPAYGLTEGSSMSVYVKPIDDLNESSLCIGKSPTHLESRVVDETGRELGVGQVGELVHRGASVTPGYWNRQEETAKVIVGGWLHTGDLVYKDQEGFYYLVGRRDNMIKSGGEKVYPTEVEEQIFLNPKVAEVAVLGVRDAEWGQSILAVVSPKSGCSLTPNEVMEYCRSNMAHFKCPKTVILVDRLPHTGSGKVDRTTLRERYGRTAPEPSAGALASS